MDRVAGLVLFYTAMGEGVCAVHWDGQTELPAEVTIPQEYHGMRVAIIAPYGFADCAELERIFADICAAIEE